MEEVKRGRGRPRKDSGVSVIEKTEEIEAEKKEEKEEPTVTQEEIRKSEKESRISIERKEEEGIIGWRITGNFRHPRTSVCYGIGEGVPEDLTAEEKENLYFNQKLSKITKSGVLVMHKKWVTLNKDQIKNLLQGQVNIVNAKIMAVNFYKDTLGEMFRMGNLMKVNKEILDTIELKIGQI